MTAWKNGTAKVRQSYTDRRKSCTQQWRRTYAKPKQSLTVSINPDCLLSRIHHTGDHCQSGPSVFRDFSEPIWGKLHTDRQSCADHICDSDHRRRVHGEADANRRISPQCRICAHLFRDRTCVPDHTAARHACLCRDPHFRVFFTPSAVD